MSGCPVFGNPVKRADMESVHDYGAAVATAAPVERVMCEVADAEMRLDVLVAFDPSDHLEEVLASLRRAQKVYRDARGRHASRC